MNGGDEMKGKGDVLGHGRQSNSSLDFSNPKSNATRAACCIHDP